MSNFRFLIFAAAFLCGAQAGAAALSDMNRQEHGRAGHDSGRCEDPAAAPSPRCALTASAEFDSQGNLWLVWAQSGRIHVAKSQDKGSHFGTPVRVNETPEKIATHGEARPKIKIGPRGNVYVTWMQQLEKRFSSHIRFSRSIDGGKTFSEPVIVNDNQDVIGHAFDSLAVGPDGKVLIAWLDARELVRARDEKNPFNGTSLYYTWSEDGGANFKPNAKIADGTCQCCRLQTEFDPEGMPVIMWRHIFPENIRDHALVKFGAWDRPGKVVRTSFENWNIEACPHHGPGLSIAENGRYHAVWFSNAKEQQGLFYGHSGDSGRTFSKPMPFGGPGASHPDVQNVGDWVVIVWTAFDGEKNVVSAMQSHDAGTTWSQTEAVAETSGAADNPFLIRHGSGIFLSWSTENEGFQLKELERKGERASMRGF